MHDTRYIHRWAISSLLLIALLWTGCSSADESTAEPGLLTIEVQGVPQGHDAELVLVGGPAHYERFHLSHDAGTHTIADLEDGSYTLEARTIAGEDRSWVVEDSFVEFDYLADDGHHMDVHYEVMELDVSDRAVGLFSDDPEHQALVDVQDIAVGDPDSDDYDPYQDTRELRFDASLLERDFQEGDLLSFAPHELMPYGYLGEVQSLEHDGDHLVLLTRRAPLTDLVLQGSVAHSGQLDPSLVDMEAKVDTFLDARDFQISEEAQALIGPNAFFDFDIDMTDDGLCFAVDDISVVDDDDGTATAGGSYCLGLDFAFDHRIINSTLDFFELTSTVTQIGELWFDLDGELDFNHRQSIPMVKLPLPPITFTVGPVPVTINIYLRAMLEVGATMEGQLSLHVEATNSVQAGLRYIGDDLHPILRHNVDPDAEISNRLERYRVRGGVGPNIDTLIYDTAGPTIGASAFVEVDVELERAGWWELYAGIGGFVGFRLQLPGIPFASWSEEIRVGDARRLIARAPLGESGQSYTGDWSASPDATILPCTSFEEAHIYLNDPYGVDPDVTVEPGRAYDHSPTAIDYVGDEPHGEEGDDGVRRIWRLDGFSVGHHITPTDGDLARLSDGRRTLVAPRLTAAGTGTSLRWAANLPDTLEESLTTLTRLDHPDYLALDYERQFKEEAHIECLPPGQYRLEVDGHFDDASELYYRPVLYDFEDHSHSQPLAIGDADGLVHTFHAGSPDAWEVPVIQRPRFRLAYEVLPVSSLTVELDGGTQYLADDTATLTIARGPQSWEVEFTESITSHPLQFDESGSYLFELTPPSHYQDLEVTAELEQDNLTIPLGTTAELSGSLHVAPPSVSNLDSNPSILPYEGGQVELNWQHHNINAQTLTISPPIDDLPEVDVDDELIVIDVPANDTMEDRHYEVTVTGTGLDGETSQATTNLQVSPLPAATLTLQAQGMDAQSSPAALVQGPQGETWQINDSFPTTLQDLYPGTYTVTPEPTVGSIYDYDADALSIDMAPGQSKTRAIAYAPTTGVLNLEAAPMDGLDSTNLATITGPDGFQETLDQSAAQWTHLAPGTYSVSAADTLAHDDGSTFAVDGSVIDLDVDAGAQTNHTLQYSRVEGWLDLNLVAALAPEPPTVHIIDDSDATVATVDQPGGLWLAPGTYSLASPGYYDADNDYLYYTDGLTSLDVDADETTSATLIHERVQASFSASPPTINHDQPSSTLQWSVDGDDSLDVEISPDVGAVDLSGSAGITATEDQLDTLDELTYTLSVSNDQGTVDWDLDLLIEDSLPVIEFATVNGGNEPVIMAPDEEITFAWEVSGPSPDQWDLPFNHPDPDWEVSQSDAVTLTGWDLACWGNCRLMIDHLLDDGSWYSDSVEFEIYVGNKPSLLSPHDDALYTVGGQTFELDLDTQYDSSELTLEADLDDSMVQSVDYVEDIFQGQRYLAFEMADDAVGTEVVELTLGDKFGDLDLAITVHAGVVNADDDVDNPPPGSLRWVADQQGDTIGFDPDLFVPGADPIILQDKIAFERPITIEGTGPESTVLQRADTVDDTFSDGVFSFSNPDSDTSMEYVLRDLAINDSPRRALYFRDGDFQHALLDNVHLQGNGWGLDPDDGPGIQSPIVFSSGAINSVDDNSLQIIDSYIGDNQGWEYGAINAATHHLEIVGSTIEYNTTLNEAFNAGAVRYFQSEHQVTSEQGMVIEDSLIAHNSHHGITVAGSLELRNTEVIGHDDEDFAGVFLRATTSGGIDIINPRFFRFLDGSVIVDNHHGLADMTNEHGCVDVSSDTTIEDNVVDIQHYGTGDPLCP